MAHLTALSDDARAVGAVNTVVFDGAVRAGYNTDWWAFRESFTRGLPGVPLTRVVQLGAGGAGAATAYAALSMGVDRLDIIDVVEPRAISLAERLERQFPGRVFASRDVVGVTRVADGVIHATPTGMASHPGLPLPADVIRDHLWIAEVVYFPLETDLVRLARARGCRTLDGSGMAVWQAVEAFRLFTGLVADPDRMRTFFYEAAVA